VTRKAYASSSRNIHSARAMGLAGQRRTPPQPRDEWTPRPAPLAQQSCGLCGACERGGQDSEAGKAERRRTDQNAQGKANAAWRELTTRGTSYSFTVHQTCRWNLCIKLVAGTIQSVGNSRTLNKYTLRRRDAVWYLSWNVRPYGIPASTYLYTHTHVYICVQALYICVQANV
jgi:hypothetical protein